MRDGKQARILLEAAKRDYSALTGMDDTVVFSDEIFGLKQKNRTPIMRI